MMVPPRNREESIDRTSEYDTFVAKLAAYHEKRGTHFDPEPRVGSRHVDLLRLFDAVIARGGYDKVSEEKLAWRKLGGDFNPGGSSNLPALAFSLKTAYYKYLAAFEISTVHGKEPPPREILEDLTAKGGGLLTRTLENFRPSARKDANIQGIDGSDASGDEDTPARDGQTGEDTPGSGGRVTRGLRQAPPQRVLFQPDTQPSRQSRHVPTSNSPAQHHSQQQQTHQPRGASASHNPQSNIDNMSYIVANYEPRQQTALSLRPVVTPSNNPTEFIQRRRLLKQQAALKSGSQRILPGIMLPGTAFDGPNIYVRCLCALKSGIPAEQDYALHHLVKISMERGDKYRFESFPGLAEALIEKVLEVSSLFYKIDWQITYTEDGMTSNMDHLDGLHGTPDVLERVKNLFNLDIDDNVQDPTFSDALLQVNEAALTLRNMAMLEENAYYISELAPLRDFLSIALNLPNLECTVELKHYALEIAEQITKYFTLEQTDPLYRSLLAQLESSDRGAILTALRAMCRISMNSEMSNSLKGVPQAVVDNIIDWLLLEDEDLVNTCLDFLYQYTAVVDNIDFLITQTQVEPLVNQLTRLLLYGAKTTEREHALGRAFRQAAPSHPPELPRDLLSQLMKLQEPERSSQWLRCLFEEDGDESITQIALWQAYQARFQNPDEPSAHALLPAADFIKNVSTTFADKAAAQVQQGPVQKFIIKGIRFRSIPVDLKGEPYTKCKWRRKGDWEQCSHFFMTAESMFEHIMQHHLHAPRLEDGRYDNNGNNEYICRWDRCSRYREGPATKLSQLASHIKVHLPAPPSSRSDSDQLGAPPAKRHKPSYIIPAKTQSFMYYAQPTDEGGYTIGIPLGAVLVLKNLARNISKTEANDNAIKENGISWVDRLFKPLQPQLYETISHNMGGLRPNMTDLLAFIRTS